MSAPLPRPAPAFPRSWPPTAARARLRAAPPLEPPPEPAPAPLRLVPAPDPHAFLFGRSTEAGRAVVGLTDADDRLFGPRPTARAALPEPGPHARRLVIATLEVMAGRRGVQQLMPHLTEETYERLAERVTRSMASRPPGIGARARIRVGRAVVCEPADGVAEVSVAARLNLRVFAVAVRLEGVDGRWRCTVLEIL